MPLPAPPYRDRLTGGAHGRSHRSLEAGSGISDLAARATHPGPTTLDDGGARATADMAALGIGYILVTPDGPRSILLSSGSKAG